MKLKILALTFLAMAFIFLQMSLAGEDPSKAKSKRLSKTAAAGKSSNILDANKVTSWWSVVEDEGFSWPPHIRNSWNGTFPRGGGVGFIYREGLVIGGFVSDGGSQVLRVQGVDYTTSLQPGRILPNKTAEDVTDEAVVRVWRVRPDYKTADLSADAAETNLKTIDAVTQGEIDAIRKQYENDWLDWPASKGAPWHIAGTTVIRNDAAFSASDPTHIPGIPGASQTIWTVCNDLNSSIAVAYMGAVPIGLEVQLTGWSYSSSTPLNNMMFQQARIIYKGTATSNPGSRIDSMYISKMADPDLGDYTDDLAGCDSVLGLGFVWNSNTVDHEYQAIGFPAPAVGFDFLQGTARRTGNAADSAVFGLQWHKGYQYWSRDASGNPLPLSAFAFYAANTGISDPTNSEMWYNVMRGALPRPQYPAYVPFYTAFSDGFPTRYLIPGDPVRRSGWLDGVEIPPGDRRIVNTTGPFSMVLGDTVEIVVAVVAGMGADNLSSVQVLKYNDSYAQFAYDNLFVLPSPPSAPVLKPGALDKQIVLNWGADDASINAIEGFNKSGFTFEGYNVYQLATPTTSLSDAVRIDTYDVVNGVTAILDQIIDPVTGAILLKPVQFGNNTGVRRTQVINQDYTRQRPLVNGQTYYFAVTAYAYNPNPLSPFRALESAPTVTPVVPQSPPPGSRYVNSYGDTVKVKRAAGQTGTSDGSVVPLVIDPTATTGHTYRVNFDTTGGVTTWKVTDMSVTPNAVKVSGQLNQAGGDLYPIIDGVMVKVLGPVPGMKSWSIPAGARRFSPVNGFAGLGLEGFSSAGDPTAYDEAAGTIGMAGHFAFGGIGTTLQVVDYRNTLLRLAAVPDTALWNPLVAPADVNFSRAYRWLRNAGNAPANPNFTPWIINPVVGGYRYQAFDYGVPFSAWDIEASPPARLAVGHFENNVALGNVDGRYWPFNASEATTNVDAREFAFILKAPYSTTPVAAYQVNLANNATMPLMWVMVCSRRNATAWPGGDQFQITANHVNAVADVFEFTSSAPSSSVALAKEDVSKINVFPNPYYGVNIMETDRLQKYVTFNHLPAQATIRVFNLMGLLVRTVEHSNGAQFERWNLRNNANLPVASGIYVIYIDMPGVGVTKILKLAVVQEEQIIPLY